MVSLGLTFHLPDPLIHPGRPRRRLEPQDKKNLNSQVWGVSAHRLSQGGILITCLKQSPFPEYLMYLLILSSASALELKCHKGARDMAQ